MQSRSSRSICLLLALCLALCMPAYAAGASVEMPVPAEGETLYVGSAEYDQCDSFQVAFVLAEDGASIHDLTLFIENLHLTVSNGFSSTNVNMTSGKTRYGGSYPIKEGGITEMSDLKLAWSSFSEGTIDAVMDYTYVHSQSGSLGVETKVPFEQREVVFERKE